MKNYKHKVIRNLNGYEFTVETVVENTVDYIIDYVVEDVFVDVVYEDVVEDVVENVVENVFENMFEDFVEDEYDVDVFEDSTEDECDESFDTYNTLLSFKLVNMLDVVDDQMDVVDDQMDMYNYNEMTVGENYNLLNVVDHEMLNVFSNYNDTMNASQHITENMMIEEDLWNL